MRRSPWSKRTKTEKTRRKSFDKGRSGKTPWQLVTMPSITQRKDKDKILVKSYVLTAIGKANTPATVPNL